MTSERERLKVGHINKQYRFILSAKCIIIIIIVLLEVRTLAAHTENKKNQSRNSIIGSTQSLIAYSDGRDIIQRTKN